MSRNSILKSLFLIYMLLLAITLWQHEMWRDELEAWNIATSSSSFSNLFHNFQYEGHPVLWFIVLWLASKISYAPETMQLINFMFAVITAWLILFRSPFSVLQKALLIFGYYFFYEYAAISRNYMIEVMMAIMICCLWKNSFQHRKWILLLLFIICQTNAFGYIFSFAFAFSLFIKEFKEQKKLLSSASYLLAACMGFVIAIRTAALPADSELTQYFYNTFDKERLFQVLTNAYNGLVPIPRIMFPMWSKPLIRTSVISAIAGLLILTIIKYYSWKRTKIYFTFFLPLLLAIMAFMYFLYPGFQRHHGQIFIALVCFIWIYKDSALETFRSAAERMPTLLFNSLLFLHFILGTGFSITDWIYPFSPAKETASFINKNYSGEQVVAGFTDCPITSVAGYLQRDVYFLNTMRHASFVLYKKGRQNTEDSTICKHLFELADSVKSVVVVLNYKLNYNGNEFLPSGSESKSINFMVRGNEKKFQIKNIFTSTYGMVGGEDFTVYELKQE